ncbi:MAG: sulfate ABC transporter substrate-binding protein [Pseudomonadota bacterium]
MPAPPRRPVSLTLLAVATLVLVCAGPACGDGALGTFDGAYTAGIDPWPSPPRRLLVAAYSAPRDVLEWEVIPAFRADWLRRHGEAVEVEATYGPSGGQVAALLAGAEADVAALARAPDLDALAAYGLITHDWRDDPWQGLLSTSLVVLAVREGNPLQVRGWRDLEREDIAVLTPDPRSSGGAHWNLAALYGAAVRAPDPQDPQERLQRMLARVTLMDRSARESMLSFEQGLGDVAITYENEVLTAQRLGKELERVIPDATLRVEAPIAVLDRWADAHGTRDLAEAFVAFARSTEAQRRLAAFGYRPVDPIAAPAGPTPFALPRDLFTVEDLGGWAHLDAAVLSPGGLYDQAQARARPH